MKFIQIYSLLACFLTLSQEELSPVQEWMYNYSKKMFNSYICSDVIIKHSQYFAVDVPPIFTLMLHKDIETIQCVQFFHKEFLNIFKRKIKTEADERFLTLLKLVKSYIKRVKYVLLSNNFKDELLDEDNYFQDESSKFLKEYYSIITEHNSRLKKSQEEINLIIDDPNDAIEFSAAYLKSWSALACKNLDKNKNRAKGPWLVPFKDFDYIMKSTKNKNLKKEITEKKEAGSTKVVSYDLIRRLRTLYDDFLKNADSDNMVDYKMKNFCMSSSFKSVKSFLELLENSFAKENIKRPYIEEKKEEVDKKMARYFPHEHVIHVLFQLIYEYFHISIGESELPYTTFAELGITLYDVNVSNERIGLFFIDYFTRPGRKIKETPYTSLLRYRVKHLNIIPLVFISLRNKCEDYFTFQEIRELFHEMGHCLQYILTDIEKLVLSGDTHEFPSIFMEHLSRQKDVIAKLCKNTENYKEYIGLNEDIKKYDRYVTISIIQSCLIDLHLFKSLDDVEEIIRRVKEKFSFQGLSHKKYDSYFPEFNYAGTRYVYILSEVMAIDVHHHINSDPNKVLDRYLEFRKLVFEMESVKNLQEAYQRLVGRNKLLIDIKPFYEFYGLPFNEAERLFEI